MIYLFYQHNCDVFFPSVARRDSPEFFAPQRGGSYSVNRFFIIRQNDVFAKVFHVIPYDVPLKTEDRAALLLVVELY